MKKYILQPDSFPLSPFSFFSLLYIIFLDMKCWFILIQHMKAATVEWMKSSRQESILCVILYFILVSVKPDYSNAITHSLVINIINIIYTNIIIITIIIATTQLLRWFLCVFFPGASRLSHRCVRECMYPILCISRTN